MLKAVAGVLSKVRWEAGLKSMGELGGLLLR